MGKRKRAERTDDGLDFEIKLESLMVGYWLGALLGALGEAKKRSRQRLAEKAYVAGLADGAASASPFAALGLIKLRPDTDPPEE